MTEAVLSDEQRRVQAAESKLRTAQRLLAKSEAALRQAEADNVAMAARLDELETENLCLRGLRMAAWWMRPRCLATRKTGYDDEASARVALADCIAARRAGGRNRRMERGVYLCESCGMWHLTKVPLAPLEADDLEPLVAALQHRWRSPQS